MAAAGRIGYPVALKAASPDIAHKTETGLVKLNLRTGAEFAAAWRELEGILAQDHAGARREGMLVQGMVRSAGGKSGDVVETIVGANRDGGFGSAVMAGLGGVFVELLRDVSLELAPLSPEGARAMIGQAEGRQVAYRLPGGAPRPTWKPSPTCSSGWQPCAARWATGSFRSTWTRSWCCRKGKAYALWTS